MNGSYFLGNQSFEVRPLPDQQPGPGCVRVRVAACGVCGTDVHIYHGGKGSADVKPPVVLGHEFSGVVEALGPGVDTLAMSPWTPTCTAVSATTAASAKSSCVPGFKPMA